MRKTRADALLKNLPEERQEEIAEYMRPHTNAETSEWLKQGGVEASARMVSNFGTWYRMSRRMEKNQSVVRAVLDDLKRNDPKKTEKDLERAGQAFFTALAIEQKDSLAWRRTREVKSKTRSLELIERRVKLLERKADEADKAREVTRRVLTPEEKEARMKEIFGIS